MRRTILYSAFSRREARTTHSTTKKVLAIAIAAIAATTISLGIMLPGTSRAAGEPQKPGFPKYGTRLASVDSVTVYSNGGDTLFSQTGTAGEEWQCVELIKRFFRDRYGHGTNWDIPTANDMWALWNNISAARNAQGNSYRVDRIFNDGSSLPVRGDALVFTGGPICSNTGRPCGHTALVTGIYDGRVYFVEQNATPFGQDSLPIINGVIKNTEADVLDRDDYTLQGWLHSTRNVPSTTQPSTIVNFEIKLPTIGVNTKPEPPLLQLSGQRSPQPPQTRNVEMRLTGPNYAKVERGTATWNPTTGFWVGAVDFGTAVPPGPRTVEIRMASSRHTLYRKVPSLQRWKLRADLYEIGKVRTYLPGPSNNDPIYYDPNELRRKLTLISGDINNDASIDILDYNILRLECYSDLAPPRNPGCRPGTADHTASDITEDGKVDGLDYNLWLRQLNCRHHNQCHDQ